MLVFSEHPRSDLHMRNKSEKKLCGPNALPPELMTPTERRAELCGLLAAGLVRFRMRDWAEVSDEIGESSLHYPADEWRHATPTHRRNA